MLMSQKLLFVCSGNYYRSRFAEMLFNAMASGSELNWRADSRGIATQLVADSFGPVSVHVLDALAARGIEVNGRVRFPIQIQEADLARADLVIAMKEAEHRAYLEHNYPHWTDKIEYWSVHDVDVAPPDETLPEIERELHALIQRLSKGESDS
jgi:protein-tyrosine phosphatase